MTGWFAERELICPDCLQPFKTTAYNAIRCKACVRARYNAQRKAKAAAAKAKKREAKAKAKH